MQTDGSSDLVCKSELGKEVAAGKGDDGLIGGFVPLDGGKSFGAKIFACQEGVQNSHTVEVKSVLVGPEVLKKLR